MHPYIVQDTPSGEKTLIYRGETDVRIHSAYSPLKESERAVESFSKGKAGIIIVCGSGLGYHLHFLAKRFPECLLVAVERHPVVIDLAREINPEFFKNVTVISDIRQVPDLLEKADMSTFRGAAVYRHRPSYLLDREFYDTLTADLQRYFTSRLSDMLTRFEFTGRWMENILNNIHHAYDSLPVKTLFGRFRGVPGIIVSAGPSLRRNITQLKKARDKALIVCVDTAFKIMEKHGISPHIVMTLDAQRHSIRHFLGIRDSSPLLLADLVSFPAVLRDYGGKRALSTTSKYHTDERGNLNRETTPLMDWIEKFAPPPGDIQSGGSVATSAFDLLLNLGCDPIILVGQDLAYTGREIHCSGSHHNEEWIAIIDRFRNLECINQGVTRKRKIKRVEAYGGGSTVVSDFVFDLYRSWFSDSAGKVPVAVINATEGGARIDNTREIPLAEAIEAMAPLKNTPADVLSKALDYNHRGDPGDLLGAVESAVGAMDEIISLPDNASNSARIILNKLTEAGTGEILDPLLKKTHVYLSRHPEIDPDRADDILANDIRSAALKIKPLLERLRLRLATLV